MTLIRGERPTRQRVARAVRDRFHRPGKGTWPTVARATVFIVLLGMFWRTVRYALAFPLWGDEAFVAVTLLERELRGAVAPAGVLPDRAAGLPLVRVAGRPLARVGRMGVAADPLPGGSGVVAGVLALLPRGATRRTTLLAVAVLAASFYPVRHAAEVKPYAIDLLVSLVLTTMGWSDLSSDGLPPAMVGADRDGDRRGLVLVSGRLPGRRRGDVAASLRRVKRSGRVRWPCVAVYCGLLAASWALMYVQFAGPQARASAFLTGLKTWREAFPPIAQPWRLPWWLVRVHTGMMLAYPQGGHNFGSTPTALLAIAGVIRMARRRARRPLLLLLLGPLPLALAAASLQRYPYGTSTRVMLYMAPAFCLLAAEGLMALLRLRHRTRRGPIAIAGVLAVLPIAGMAHDVVWPYVGFDNVVHRRLARRSLRPRRRPTSWSSSTASRRRRLIPDLMITRWLQRVAVVRYYLRTSRRAPIRWAARSRRRSSRARRAALADRPAPRRRAILLRGKPVGLRSGTGRLDWAGRSSSTASTCPTARAGPSRPIRPSDRIAGLEDGGRLSAMPAAAVATAAAHVAAPHPAHMHPAGHAAEATAPHRHASVAAHAAPAAAEAASHGHASSSPAVTAHPAAHPAHPATHAAGRPAARHPVHHARVAGHGHPARGSRAAAGPAESVHHPGMRGPRPARGGTTAHPAGAAPPCARPARRPRRHSPSRLDTWRSHPRPLHSL